MRELNREQIDKLTSLIEKNGGETLHIDNDLDEYSTYEQIEEVRYHIQCELEKALQDGVTVNNLSNAGSTMSFYCHLKKIPPRNRLPDGTMTKYVRREVSNFDLRSIVNLLSKQSATTLSVERSPMIREVSFVEQTIHKIKQYVEREFNTEIIVRPLETENPKRKQFFISFEGYGNFDRPNLGPLDY